MQPRTNIPPTIDGVKPAPKLSGENQHHYSGQSQPPAQTANPPAKSQPKIAPSEEHHFPYVALSVAGAVCIILIIIAVMAKG